MDHTIAARCPDPGEQRTSWRDDMLHDSPWESFLILTDDGNQWKSGLISWNACKIPLFAGFWSILSINWINCNISPIECLFHSSIWWPYRMKLQPLQRWALRKRWMWASWCKGCHVPSNSNIWFISCPLAIAYLMFLCEIRSKVRRSTVDSPNLTELDDTTLPFGYVWKMICFVQFYDIHHMCINWHSICVCA